MLKCKIPKDTLLDHLLLPYSAYTIENRAHGTDYQKQDLRFVTCIMYDVGMNCDMYCYKRINLNRRSRNEATRFD
jgi:hypothetical protein